MQNFFKTIFTKLAKFFKYLKFRLKTNIPLTIITIVFSLFCMASAIYFASIGRVRDAWICLYFFIVVPFFYILEYLLKIKCPTMFGVVLYIFLLTGFIGACYNVYTYIPFLDDISHATFGAFFAIFGFAIFKRLIGEPDTPKKFFACVLFAIGFSLTMAAIWELFEFTMDCVSPNYDMQEDTIVHNIHSFFLHTPYDHLNTEIIDGIAKTILYDAQGNIIYVIEGGYLDIGIIDTMCDTFWCLFATLFTCTSLAISWCAGKRKVLYNLFIPKLNVNQSDDKIQPNKN